MHESASHYSIDGDSLSDKSSAQSQTVPASSSHSHITKCSLSDRSITQKWRLTLSPDGDHVCLDSAVGPIRGDILDSGEQNEERTFCRLPGSSTNKSEVQKSTTSIGSMRPGNWDHSIRGDYPLRRGRMGLAHSSAEMFSNLRGGEEGKEGWASLSSAEMLSSFRASREGDVASHSHAESLLTMRGALVQAGDKGLEGGREKDGFPLLKGASSVVEGDGMKGFDSENAGRRLCAASDSAIKDKRGITCDLPTPEGVSGAGESGGSERMSNGSYTFQNGTPGTGLTPYTGV